VFCNRKSDKKDFSKYNKEFQKRKLIYSLVGIAIRYGMDGAGQSPVGRDISRTRSDLRWGPPSLLFNVYRLYSLL